MDNKNANNPNNCLHTAMSGFTPQRNPKTVKSPPPMRTSPGRGRGGFFPLLKSKVSSSIPFSLLLIIPFLLLTTPTPAQQPIDAHATKQTKALYTNLRDISEKYVMFGHQETGAYGVQWKEVPGRSDVKDVAGSFPAVHGWDIGKEGTEKNVDGVPFTQIRELIKQVYKRGGVNTVSWHGDNPVSLGHSWDTTRAVQHILPGGKDHQKYVARLDLIADFFHSCKVGSTKTPIIFRPFHEHNGDWFWWGKSHCTEPEYIALWRFTVDYLKITKKVNHLLYAFSPDRSRFDMDSIRASYLYGYPGDDYVDIIGIDDYMDVGISWNQKTREEQDADLYKVLQEVSAIAIEKNKVAAFTETGLEGVILPTWYTEVLLAPAKAKQDIKIAYAMVWRNANEKHHYAPYPGHHSVADFIKFYEDERTLFERDLKKIYKPGKFLAK